MLVSLIIGTLNRSEYLSYCLESLKKQTYDCFEVIVVDQSSNEETKKMLNQLDWEKVIYERVDYKGLSKARNNAIKKAKGDIICLIDDDAYYEEHYIENVVEHFSQLDARSIITGYLWDATQGCSFVDYKKLKNGKKLSLIQVTRYCPSPGLSFPANLINEIGLFDTEFGVGSRFGAAEETDFLIRAIKTNYKVFFFDDVYAKHPHEKVKIDEKDLTQKSYKYSYGKGAMFKKNMHGRLKKQIALVFFERLLRDLVKGIRHKEDVIRLKNKIRGYRDYGSDLS